MNTKHSFYNNIICILFILFMFFKKSLIQKILWNPDNLYHIKNLLEDYYHLHHKIRFRLNQLQLSICIDHYES